MYLRVDDNIGYGDADSRNIINSASSAPSGVQTFRTFVDKIAEITNANTTGSITQLAGAMIPFRTMDYGKFYTVQT